MFWSRVSSSGMRLVPETNTQKPSVPRLNYKAFGGARPARSTRRMKSNDECDASGEVRTRMGRVCSHRLGRPEALLEIGTSRQPEAGAGGIAEHAGGGGDLGRRLAAEVWRPPHRRLFGAGARSFDLYADQVRAPGAVSGAPHHRSTIPGNVLYFRCQGDPNDTGFLLDLLLRHRERL